jgi:hypothetical protein
LTQLDATRRYFTLVVAYLTLPDAIWRYLTLRESTRRYSTLLESTRRYSTLLDDATLRYLTLLHTTPRYSTVIDATGRYLTLLSASQRLLDAIPRYLTLSDATWRYSNLYDAIPRYSNLLDAIPLYSTTLLDASRRHSTLLDATRRYPGYSTIYRLESYPPTVSILMMFRHKKGLGIQPQSCYLHHPPPSSVAIPGPCCWTIERQIRKGCCCCCCCCCCCRGSCDWMCSSSPSRCCCWCWCCCCTWLRVAQINGRKNHTELIGSMAHVHYIVYYWPKTINTRLPLSNPIMIMWQFEKVNVPPKLLLSWHYLPVIDTIPLLDSQFHYGLKNKTSRSKNDFKRLFDLKVFFLQSLMKLFGCRIVDNWRNITNSQNSVWKTKVLEEHSLFQIVT